MEFEKYYCFKCNREMKSKSEWVRWNMQITCIPCHSTLWYMRTYKDINKRIRKRDNDTCQKCGEKKGLTVHHIIPRIDGGSNLDNNLITLCDVCHMKAHKEINAKKKAKRGLKA